jgi:hypothetical protein
MKTLRNQLIERISNLGGETPHYYDDFSDYDLLEDYENLLRAVIEDELRSSDTPDVGY